MLDASVATSLHSTSLDSTAHIIQIALTPVFLLSGIATLLNVFGTRLARVADQTERISQAIDGATGPEQHRLALRMNALRRRSLALDAAVILGALGGGPPAAPCSRSSSAPCGTRPWRTSCSPCSGSPSSAP